MLVSVEDIRNEFYTLGVDLKSFDVIDKMRELCMLYAIEAVDLAEYWFAFSTSKNIGSEPTLDLLTKLETEEFSKIKKQKRLNKSLNKSISSPKTNFATTDVNELIDDTDCLLEAYGTPETNQAAKKRQRSPTVVANKKFGSSNGTLIASPSYLSPNTTIISTPSNRYSSRTNSGDVLCGFGSTVDWNQTKSNPCSVKAYKDESVVASRYRYMYQKNLLVSQILNDKIESLTAFLKNQHSIDDPVHIRLPSTEEVNIVGRVLCDSNGRLNPSSILIEGSQETSSGYTVKLDVSNLQSYSFFPGQILAFSGVNSTADKFIARKIHSSVVPSLPETCLSFSSDDPLTLMVASGSYMTSDSLTYDPLCDFLNAVALQKPSVCILIGPFVDAKHKDIEEGNFDETYESIFNHCLEMILSCAKGSKTEFMIVPSSRDIHHDFIYPTPPFRCSKTYMNEKNVHFVSDPCLLDMSGLIVGITATDVLLHLGREEISFPSMPDRLSRLAGHLLQQHSFYPLYPPSEDINVDYEKLETAGLLSVTPHLMFLPSDLNYFIKDVQGCCCINPQRLTKGTSGGTYARLQIRTNDDKSIVSSAPQVSCQILRI